MVRITIINDENVKRGFSEIAKSILRKRRSLLLTISRELKMDVKKRIVKQDGGAWDRPSKWTRAKKGRRKALVGTSKFIKHQAIKEAAVVFGDIPGNWTFTQHHFGFRKAPTGKRVFLSLQRPSALNPNPGPKMSFISTRESVTPARKIWPTVPHAKRITLLAANPWIRKTARRALAKAGIRGIV